MRLYRERRHVVPVNDHSRPVPFGLVRVHSAAAHEDSSETLAMLTRNAATCSSTTPGNSQASTTRVLPGASTNPRYRHAAINQPATKVEDRS